MIEKTLVLLKPGVLQRRIAGEVLSRFERKGLKILAIKMILMDKPMTETLYSVHRHRDFYDKLVDYTLSGPVIALILEGEGCIGVVRRLAGPTDIRESPPGTIRGDYAGQTRLNIIHASDSLETAEGEISIFFSPADICQWEDGNSQWF